MAYAASGLVLWAHGNDKKFFRYDSASDSFATIAASGYFANTANLSRLSVGDLIYANGSDGAGMLKVTAVAATTGSVTTASTGVSQLSVASTASTLPATGTVNINSTAAQSYALPTPYAGARLTILKTTSATASQTVSATAGGTAATIGLTGVTLTFNASDQSVILEGVSATKWQIASNVGSVTVS